jgi:hypothetical protein
MTARKTTSSKAGAKKLQVRKETIKDLDGKGRGKDVKGGQRGPNWTTTTDRCTNDIFCPTR